MDVVDAAMTRIKGMEGSVDEAQEAREQQAAAVCLQRMYRCHAARLQLRQALMSVYEKFYDAASGAYYYLDKRTGETSWEKPRMLRRDEDIALTAVFDGNGTTRLEAEAVAEMSALRVEDGSNSDAGDNTELIEQQHGGYSMQDVALAREQFAHYDVDASGSINAMELHNLFMNLGETLPLSTVREIIKAVDGDGDGEVTFDEFLHLLRTQQDKNHYAVSLALALVFGPKELTKLKQQFMVLDLDSSGAIDKHELLELIKKLGRRVEEFDVPAMLRDADADGSGSISFNAFLQIVATMAKTQDRNGPTSSFVSLLDLGIAQGLLNGLDEIVQASRRKFLDWLHRDQIIEEKRLEMKLNRQRRQQEAQQQQDERDRVAYAKYETELAAIEQARCAQVEGLVIDVEFQGDGRNFPTKGQFARVHYVASFESTGETFESTRTRCSSALEFCVGAGHTIAGFDLALQRMSVGETARVTIAPALAYGVEGRPPRIPPNATLVFRIELISINEKLQASIDVAPVTRLLRTRNR